MSLFTKNLYTPHTRHQKTTQSRTYNPLIARQLIPLHRYVAGSRPSQGRLKAVQSTPQPLSEKYLHPLNPSDPSSFAHSKLYSGSKLKIFIGSYFHSYSSNGYIVKIMMDYSLMTDFDSNLFYKETFVLSVHLHH